MAQATGGSRDALQFIVDFVEGRIEPLAFADRLYEDESIERVLKDSALQWGTTPLGTNPYRFCIEQDFESSSGILNARNALELFLKRKGIAFTPDRSAQDRHELLLQVQPTWLDLDVDWVQRHVLVEANGKTGKDLERWLRNRLRELFRCHKRPPRWITHPAWPISENGPLYFLGQIALKDCDLFQDEAAAFVFVDPASGATETIIQIA